jgi:rhodanese-related sulfurtransferase
MACCGIKTILVQMLVISVVGVGAGLVDSVRRPIKLGRDAPADPFATPTGTTTGTTPPANSSGTPKPALPNSDLKPGDPGWTQTPKDALPKGQVTLDDAKRLFNSSASFVDARRKEDYELGHIKGAIRLNLKSFENGDPPLLAMIPRESFVVVYCSGGNCDESEHVAEFLSNSGYAKVYVIHDGFPGWKAMGWPIETGEGIQ